MGSSAKSGGGSKSYNYYGTIACVICEGPVDELYGIEVDDELKWSGKLTRATSPNPVTITVPDRGNILFFWGTDDQQTPDILLPLRGSPSVYYGNLKLSKGSVGNGLNHTHPPYRGLCYAVLIDFLFGQEREQSPQVRFFTRRRPKQNIITGAAAALTDGQANPIATIAEILTSPSGGLAWPESRFDREKWQRAADIAQAKNLLTGVSLVIEKQAAARSYVDDLLDMCDAYIRTSAETGLCEIIVFSDPADIDVDSLAVITSAELTAPPELKHDTWDDIPTRWLCSYRDRDKNFKDRSVKHDEPRARFASGTKRPEKIQRPMIVRVEQATAHLQERARRYGVPGTTGKLSVRLDIDPEPGGEQLRQVCRVIDITRKAKGELKISIETERTLSPILYTPAPDDPVEPPAPPAAVPDIAHARLLECPPALAGNENFNIAALVSRSGNMVTDYQVYYDKDANDLFPSLGGARSFAYRARLNADIPASSEGNSSVVKIETLDEFSPEIIDENPGETAARNDTMLMFVIKSDVAQGGQIKADDAGKAWIEVFSCVEFIASGDGLLDVTAMRARQGTKAHAFSAGDEVWIIRRDNLAVMSHADFAQLAAAGQPAYFKLQACERSRVRPIEDCAPRSFSFALARDVPALGDTWHLEYRYRYQDIKPTAPVGDSPAGWPLTRPESGGGVLWCVQARKRDDSNTLIGVWSDPTRVEGRRTFYQKDEPDPITTDIMDGDWWFNTGANNKQYRWDAPTKKWVGIFGVEADAFFVEGGVAFIKEAAIQKISAGKITSGEIEGEKIVLSGADASIQSDDYEPGKSGSRISGAGAEFSKVVIRDSLVISSLQPPAIDPPPCMFNGTITITPVVPAAMTLFVTFDGTPPTYANAMQWPGGKGAYQAITRDASVLLRARLYDDTGRSSDEVIAFFGRLDALPQVSTPIITLNAAAGSATNVTLTCATAGATIMYQLNGGAAVTYAGGQIAIAAKDYVVVYATKAGYSKSAVTSWSNTVTTSTSGGDGDKSLQPWRDRPIWILP